MALPILQTPFAAAVTTGKLMGFDYETMEDAIAIATSNLGGNYQHYFTWDQQ